MNIRKILNKIVVLLSAFSLFWIIAGSVVEFHQKYVFHNHVELWQAITCKTVSDQKKIVQNLDKDLLMNFEIGHCNAESVHETKMLLTLSSMESIFSDYHYDLITAQYRPDLVFRGPPMA
jgi:hypothetical protein